MKILGKGTQGLFKETKINEDRGRTDKNDKTASVGKTGGSETVLFSKTAKEIQKVNRIISDAPDIRTDKVNEIKDKIDKGEYHVTGEEIAAKLLKELVVV